MTRRKVAVALAVLGAAAAAIVIWRVFFPNDKTRIIRTLDNAADAVGIKSGESPAAALAKVRRLETLLDERIEYRIRINRKDYTGTAERRSILATLAAWRKTGGRFEIKLADYNITVSGDTARAEAAAEVSGAANGQEFSRQEDVEIGLVRRDGKWRIDRFGCRNFMEK